MASEVARREVLEQMRKRARRSYRAVMRNGELVEAEDGYLMVTHNNMVVNTGHAHLNTHNTTTQLNTSHNTTTQDSPLNLSVKDQMITLHHSDTDSGYNPSPQTAQEY